jgi:hypothetical protein
MVGRPLTLIVRTVCRSTSAMSHGRPVSPFLPVTHVINVEGETSSGSG